MAKRIYKVISGTFTGVIGTLISSAGMRTIKDRTGDRVLVTQSQIEYLENRSLNLMIKGSILADYIDIDGSIKYGANSGGYESFVYFITSDGGTLAIQTVIDELDSTDFTDPHDPQWHIIGAGVNYEDHDLIDDHTNKPIPAAYGC